MTESVGDHYLEGLLWSDRIRKYISQFKIKCLHITIGCYEPHIMILQQRKLQPVTLYPGLLYHLAVIHDLPVPVQKFQHLLITGLILRPLENGSFMLTGRDDGISSAGEGDGAVCKINCSIIRN